MKKIQQVPFPIYDNEDGTFTMPVNLETMNALLVAGKTSVTEIKPKECDVNDAQ